MSQLGTGYFQGARQDMEGIWVERQGEVSQTGLRIAPIISRKALKGVFNVFNESWLLDETAANNPLTPKSMSAPAATGGIARTTVNYDVENYPWGHNILPQAEIDADLEAGIDSVSAYTRKMAAQGVQHHARKLGQFLSTTTNFKSANRLSGLTVTDVSAQLATKIDAALELLTDDGVDISTGMIVVMNRYVAKYCRKLLEVQEGVALAGYTTAGGALVSAGHGTMDLLSAYFASKFEVPIELVMLPHKTIQSAGVAEALNHDIVLLKSEDSSDGDGFVKTVTPSEASALGMVHSRESWNPVGIEVYVQSLYDLVVTSTALGVHIDGVAS